MAGHQSDAWFSLQDSINPMAVQAKHTPWSTPSASAASLLTVSSPRSLTILFLELLFDYEMIQIGKRTIWTGSASPGPLLQTSSIFVSDMLL